MSSGANSGTSDFVNRGDMRITRRTGGGRGDYEISGNANHLSPRDLIDHRIKLSLADKFIINTGVYLRHRNGKFRLRTGGVSLHVHRQLAAVLLMPMAVRANSALGSSPDVIK